MDGLKHRFCLRSGARKRSANSATLTAQPTQRQGPLWKLQATQGSLESEVKDTAEESPWAFTGSHMYSGPDTQIVIRP